MLENKPKKPLREMKKVFLIITVLAFNLSNAQEQSYTYDSGSYSNPVRNPTIRNNPWVNVEDLTIEQTQEKIISLVNLSHMWNFASNKLVASFKETDQVRFLYIERYSYHIHIGVYQTVYDLSNTVKFNGIGMRDKNTNILNIYMMKRVNDRQYQKKGKIVLKKEKLSLVLMDYDKARELYILLQHYQNLLNS